ncbi:hypothetical protein EYF80_055011 [Liparis tanakae]|uniref:Uncharacterized protein n=1 Tax=Liparis tanakae TaxID=230148 RepID=A0A4Z2F1J0_9TELE|nr:hypothetical protein EYF80_055011 [Liparis tanakae]
MNRLVALTVRTSRVLTALTDLGQEVGDAGLTRAVVLPELPLVVWNRPTDTERGERYTAPGDRADGLEDEFATGAPTTNLRADGEAGSVSGSEWRPCVKPRRAPPIDQDGLISMHTPTRADTALV